MMYAINRQLEYFDMPQVRKMARDAEKENYTLTSLVLGLSIRMRSASRSGGRLQGGSQTKRNRNCPQ